MLTVLWRRLVAAPGLTDGGSGAAVSNREGVPSSSLVLRFLSLSFSPRSSSSLVFFPSLSFVLSLPSLSSVFFRFLLAPPLCSLPVSSPSVLPPLLLLCWLLFIGPSEWVCTVEHGEQPAGRPWGATAKARPPSPVFWQVRGGWSAIVFGRWAPGERVAGKNSKKKSFLFSFFPAA